MSGMPLPGLPVAGAGALDVPARTATGRREILAAALVVLAVVLTVTLFRSTNTDFADFYLPWWEEIRRRGWFASLAADFSDYSPPYIYLLATLAVFADWARPETLIKLMVMGFALVAAWQGYAICRLAGQGQRAALVSAVILGCLPEVLLNTVVWGQSDIIHTAALLGLARLVLLRRPAAAMLMFGIACAVKPQSLLAGPVAAWLVLSGFVGWRQVLLVPLAWGLMMLPAILAGRPAAQLFTLVGNAYGTHLLASAAPNGYVILQKLVPAATEPMRVAGLLLTAAAGLAMMASFVRRGFPVAPASLLLMFALPLVLLPYLLPGMHERYFFAGATFTALAALLHPGLTLAAALLQVVNILTYLRFFLETRETLLLAILLMPVPVLLLLRRYREDARAA